MTINVLSANHPCVRDFLAYQDEHSDEVVELIEHFSAAFAMTECSLPTAIGALLTMTAMLSHRDTPEEFEHVVEVYTSAYYQMCAPRFTDGFREDGQ